MSDAEKEQYFDSDSSDNEEQHSKLLNTISQLDNTQRVKPATRNEVSTEVSEYNLQKGASKKDFVKVNELANTLKKKAKHVAISKKLKQITGKSRTLPKPLEKPVEDKLKRIIGYENVKKQIKRWNAVVEKNSLKDHLSFPLNRTSMKLQSSTEFFNNFQTKTPLEIEVAKVLKQDEQPEIKNDQIKYPLTLEEMLEKRKEMAHLRAKLSYKEAKAQRQKKIKSKKYHRILKREKIKQQLKDFEILQKADPSKALEKLEELDKNRILERASLRHRNTGKWAKNMTVKAKYDVESRKILAEQLKLSKEITEKVKALDSDNEEEKMVTDSKSENDVSKSLIVSKDNPWSLDVSKEMEDFVSGYKKFWEEKNKELNKNEINQKINDTWEVQQKSEESKDIQVSQKTDENDVQTLNSVEENEKTEKSKKNLTQSEQVSIPKILCDNNSNKMNAEGKKKKTKSEEKIVKNHIKVKKKNKEAKATPVPKMICEDELITVRPTSGIWTVTTVVDSSSSLKPKIDSKKVVKKSINNLFSDLEEDMIKKAAKKIKAINKKLKKEGKQVLKKQKKVDKVKEKKLKLSLKKKDQVLIPELDVGLLEGDAEEETEISGCNNPSEPVSEESKTVVPEIDPKNFIEIKPKRLNVDLPEDVNDDAIDDDLNEVQQKMIEEAFGEDDVTAEFQEIKKKEKENEMEISMSLPGWGEWGGSGIQPTKRKKKRFTLVKLPSRKDQKKKDLIINENENPNIKNHLVKNIPHPFLDAEAFESNLRSPIGRDWIPESAHLRLIQKPVETKLGMIINPMSEDEIIKCKKEYESPYKGMQKHKPSS